jgi:hypothetical protein
MYPLRVQIKLFAENPAAVDQEAFIAIFQRWIQNHGLESQQLIDVADYRHVFQGPGVVLIAFDADYALDSGNGELGLLYTRKRQTSDLATQLDESFRGLLNAAALIEAEKAFGTKFRTDRLEIRIVDRLNYPNAPETFARVEGDFRAVLSSVYGATAFTLKPLNSDPRLLFGGLVEAPGAPDVKTLRETLLANAAKEA